MKYCEYCGQKMLSEENFCPACGAPTAREKAIEKKQKSEEKSKKTARVILCVSAGVTMLATCLLLAALAYLGFVFYAIYAFFFVIVVIAAAFGGNEVPIDLNILDPRVFFIAAVVPMLWIIPMAIVLFVKGAKGEKISKAFKICTFLFCSIPAGIILLFVKNEED